MRRWIIVIGIGLALGFAPVQAEPADRPAPQLDIETRITTGAICLFGTSIGPGEPALSAIALLRAGDEQGCWSLVDTSIVRPFPDAWRQAGFIHDEKPVLGGLEGDAYAQSLALAHWTDAAAFDQAAKRDLTYVQIFREPARYRGEVVRIAGRMKRVRMDELFDNRQAAQGVDEDRSLDKARLAGVSRRYEGWLFNDDFGANPVCCVFTRLPEGLRVAERMEQKVVFAGYLFKRYRYKAGDTPGANQWRDAPLLIGAVTQLLPPAPAVTESDWGRPLLPAFLCLVGGTIVLVITLTLWFRRSDERVRRRLARTREHELGFETSGDELDQ